MISSDSLKFPKHVKIPQWRRFSKLNKVMPMKEGSTKTLKELMEDSEILLKSNVSLVTFVTLNENENETVAPCEENKSCEDDAITMLIDKPSTCKQKKKSKFVNYTSTRQSAILNLDPNALERIKNIEEPKLNHYPKYLRSKTARKNKSMPFCQKELKMQTSLRKSDFRTNSYTATKKSNSLQISEHLTETDYYCMEWMTRSLDGKSKSQKYIIDKILKEVMK